MGRDLAVASGSMRWWCALCVAGAASFAGPASLPEGRWLRGVELETSLDYLATGIPKHGDAFEDGTRYLDDASHWSLSFVIVIPIARF